MGISKYADRYSSLSSIVSGLMLIAVLGTLDYLTGPEIGFSLFYIAPIAGGAWFFGKKVGIIFSVAAALTWLIADLSWQVSYSHFIIPYWNASMRLCIFLLFSFLIAQLHEVQRSLEAKVTAQTVDLKTEIEWHKSAEAELGRLNRLYSLLSNINQAILRTPDPQSLYDRVCQVAVDEGKFKMAWIGTIDESGRRVMVSSSRGYIGKYFEGLGGSVPLSEDGTMPMILAIRKGEPFISNDIEHDRRAEPWRDKALNNSYRSCASFPLKVKGRYVGAFTLFSNEIDFFDTHEVKLLIELSNDVSFYLEFNELEKERKTLQEQFLQSQKMESLGTLAGGIAHDFNNILGIIMGHASLVGEGQLVPDKMGKSVDAILKATTRGASLIKQLLTFARKTEVIIESVRVNDIIAEMSSMLHETFSKTISISMSLQPNLPVINADASQIHQVLLNLCVNARDAMPKGGTLFIATDIIESENLASRFPGVTNHRYVCIVVSDTGIGMNDDTRQRIFEPFFTTKGVGKGTGLGLSMVFGVVEYHHGFIEVQSKLGEGTVFKVYLPVDEHIPERYKSKIANTDGLPGGTETILFIEDEDLLRDFVTNVLTSKGYIVIPAETGHRGFELFERFQKDIALVLSDLGLPGLNGEVVLKKILEIRPSMKVLLASGFIDVELRSRLQREGVRNFLQKPYSQSDLLLKVREVIDAPAIRS